MEVDLRYYNHFSSQCSLIYEAKFQNTKFSLIYIQKLVNILLIFHYKSIEKSILTEASKTLKTDPFSSTPSLKNSNKSFPTSSSSDDFIQKTTAEHSYCQDIQNAFGSLKFQTFSQYLWAAVLFYRTKLVPIASH